VADLAELVQRAAELDRNASQIQKGRQAGMSDDAIRAFAEEYQNWYADAYSLIPADLLERFRSEYEGSMWSSKIKAFLANPTAQSPLFNPENETPLITYWLNTYEQTFRGPLQSQRQILMEAQRRTPPSTATTEAIQVLQAMFRRFGDYARALNRRRTGRSGIEINDEYDVQDVVEAALRLLFDDVRPEEPTPSRAGAASRIDFVLKREQVVVETKMTRRGLGDKQLGAELLIDIGRYRAHPDCKALVILVYDPDHLVTNPKGLEDDLNGSSDGMQVVAVVCQT
jgi:hypothetical protein